MLCFSCYRFRSPHVLDGLDRTLEGCLSVLLRVFGITSTTPLMEREVSRVFDESPSLHPRPFPFLNPPCARTAYTLYQTHPSTMPVASRTLPQPLVSDHSLPKAVDLTTSVGSEFPSSVQLSQLLAPEAHPSSIKDLALLVSQRGVVFFRDQDLDTTQQLELVDRLGLASGRPNESGVHVHPLGSGSELGGGAGGAAKDGKQAVFKITAGELISLDGCAIGSGSSEKRAHEPGSRRNHSAEA